ncbi:hypothetical protein NXX61_26570 [Bacteroides ovatus]|nr:hypothetical protein [Bacteroides ovatus]
MLSVQAEASINIIKGKVTCEGKGMGGVMVTDGHICVQTDASGKYSIPTLETVILYMLYSFGLSDRPERNYPFFLSTY